MIKSKEKQGSGYRLEKARFRVQSRGGEGFRMQSKGGRSRVSGYRVEE